MVNFENEVEFEVDFDLEQIANAVVDKVLASENCPKACEVEVLLTDEATVHAINKEYRNVDSTTDVLSFPNVEWDEPANYGSYAFEDDYLINPETGLLMLGQIVLCKDRIIQQSKDFGHSIKREYAFLIAHSMLHLLGYDHMDPEEAIVMEEKQRKYLHEMDIKRE